MTEIPELTVVFLGLASAVSFGAGDFTGGLATKRSDALSVVMISQTAGIILLSCMAILLREPFPGTGDLALGAGAGLAGAIGLVTFYRALAIGPMGMVAPTTAVIGAAIPVAFGLLFEGLPGIQQLAGLILAFLAVWLVSAAGRSVRVPFSNLGLPLSAGSMFGLFFILMGQVSPGTVFWPLVAARAASLSTLFLVAIFRRDIRLPVRRQVPLIALAGILDAGGNIFYTLAAQVGRLDIAAMLSSFYPASTVLLARVVLKEVISPRQWAGLSVALIAILLITS